MYTSEGGGYCDCGDEEAFLQFHVCNVHKEQRKDSEPTTSSHDPLDGMPCDMQVRTRRLFTEIMRYIFEITSPKRKTEDLMVGGKDKDCWPELRHTFELANKCLVLINDNFHNYAEVTKVVKKSLNCNQKMAHDVTEFVDKEGRAICYVGKYEECAPIRDKIEATSRRDGRSLKCEIFPTHTIAHQNFAVRLLRWLYNLLKKYSGFRALFVQIAQDKHGSGCKIQMPHFPLLKDLTICEAILVNDAKMWKVVRKAWFNVLIEGIMKDYEAKKILAQNYVKHYKIIMNDFVSDDQETDISITNISVQIFTVPTVAHDLIESHNAFHIMADYFMENLQAQESDEGQLLLEQWMEDVHNEFDRVHHVLLDIQYLLSKAPAMTDTWSEKMRQSFLEGAKTFLKILAAYQGIDPHRRETHQHVEFESLEWESVFKLSEPTWQIAEKVMEWGKTDKVLFMKLLEETVGLALDDFSRRFSKYDMITSNVELEETDNQGMILKNSSSYEFIDMDVGREMVSVNTPLQRFLGGLIPFINDFGLKRSTDRIIEATRNFPSLIEPALSTVTMLCQAACGLWRRNGTTIEGISFIYHQFLPKLKQNDLIMLQLAAAISDDRGGCVVQTLLHRFRLIKWANGEFEEGEVSEEENIKTVHLADEFLKMVLAMLCERFTHNIGRISKKDELRYHVTHMLCTGPLTHSDITKQLRHRIKDGMEGDLEDVIKEVGKVTQSKKDPSKKVFELKQEHRQHYNPFYYYYTREQNSTAIITQAEYIKTSEMTCLVPPNMPSLTDVFEALPKMSACAPILKVIDTTLKKFSPKVGMAENDPFVSNVQENSLKHLHKILCIIIIGCEDDLRTAEGTQSVGSEFVQAAQKLQFSEKLAAIQFFCSPPKDVTDLMQYTISRLLEAKNKVLKIEPTHMQVSQEATTSNTSKSLENSPPVNDVSDCEVRKRRAEAAAIHRAKVMAQMNKMQKQFMEKNALKLDEVMDTETSLEVEVSNTRKPVKSQRLQKKVAVGNQKSEPQYDDKKMTCILCQEEHLAWSGEGKEVLVMASYVTKSAVFSQFDTQKYKDSNSYCSNSQIHSEFGCCPSISSCGHVMHAKCYQQFFDSLVTKARDNLFRQILNYDVDSQEYLCPICERLCNNVLPVLPPVTKELQCQITSDLSFDKWIEKSTDILSEKYLDEPNGGASSAFPHSIEDIVCLVLKKPTTSLKDTPSFPKISEQLRSMTIAFAINTFSKSLATYPSEEDSRVLHLNLQSLIVSLHLGQSGGDDKFDQVLIDMKTRETDTLRSLTKLCFMLPFSFSQKASNSAIKYLRSNAIYLLSILLKNDHAEKNFNHFDMFGMLVFIIVSYPALTYPDRETNFALGREDHNILLLCFIAHIIQIMVNFPISQLEKAKMEKFGPIAEEDKCIKLFGHKISTTLGIEYFTNISEQKTTVDKSTNNLSVILKTKLLRFLRCSALFFHFYTDIPLPDNAVKGNNPQFVYEALTTYLGLPTTITNLLQIPGVTEITDR